MAERHYFWGKAKPSQFDPDYGKTASRMYLEGSQVFLEGEMYDHEDNRLYENSGSFSVDDYRRAIQELQQQNETHVVNPVSGCTLSLRKENGRVEIRLSGATYPSSTPSGAALSSTAFFNASLNQLQLPK